MENIFEITKAFRNNGERSDLHRTEFFILEWYRAYKDYYSIMDDCIEYLKFIGREIYNKDYILYNKKRCDLKEIKKIKLKDIFSDHDIDLDNYSVKEKIFINEAAEVLKMSKKELKKSILTKEDLFFKFFMTHVEPFLGWENPTIIYEYPIEMASLSKKCDDDPLYAKRFELYICGIEIANAFDELIDPIEQKKRFNKIISYRKKSGKYNLNLPKNFIRTIEYGMPPRSGIALGLERLFMLWESISSIDQTNIFNRSVFL